MKHVFVETNFIIELVRPFAAAEAHRLASRNGVDVVLHVPWVSIVESKRTLDRIVSEDLGFEHSMKQFAVRERVANRLSKEEMNFLNDFADRTKNARALALGAIATDVDKVVAAMNVIEPSRDVVEKTLAIYPIKSLPPFDEMVMGAVLSRAEELVKSGERDFYFCNLNTKDFDPTNRPTLRSEYQRLTISYLASFRVP